MNVEKGHKVTLHYTGTLEDGQVFDSSEGKEPLQFVAGEGMVIPGFDKAILGMKKDEEKEFTIKPEEGYGMQNPELVKKVPKDQLPQDKEPEVGMMLMVSLPTGQQIPAKIVSVDDKEIGLDLNHPLAGKTLTFKIKIVDVSENDQKEETSAEDLKKELEGK